MRKMMSSKPGVAAAAVAAALGLALFAALPAAAQGTPPAQPAQQQPAAGQAQQPGAAQNPAPPAQPPVNKEEDDAYKAFVDLTNEQLPQVLSQGEAFLAKYPSSRYRNAVYTRLVVAYLSAGQADKIIATGEKAIAENPDNVDVLAILSTVLPRAVDPRSLDADTRLNQAESYARHAIQLISMIQKPGGMTDEQFTAAKNAKLGMAHYGLGLVAYKRGNAAGAVPELEQAAQLDPSPEPLLFYLLGTGEMKQQKFPDAVAAFDRCANAPWDPQWQARCKKGAEDAKQKESAPPAAKP
jgi:tetratricopeptide (TPR) repeat protein